MAQKKKSAEQQKAIDIGVPFIAPQATCDDKHCPFHAGLKLRGRSFEGKVIRNVIHKTTIIEFPRRFYLPKYERFEKRRTRIKAHVPPCLPIVKGDTIKIMESRPISKTKNFVAFEVIKK